MLSDPDTTDTTDNINVSVFETEWSKDNSKKMESMQYFTTGFTYSTKSLFRPFFLDAGRLPAAIRVSIQFHMVSYSSAIKVSVFETEWSKDDVRVHNSK